MSSSSSPKLGGHPSMSNILAIAKERSKLQQIKHKMKHDLLKGQMDADKRKLDMKYLKTETEMKQLQAETDLKVLKAKSKSNADSHELKKQGFALKKEEHAFKRRTQPRKSNASRKGPATVKSRDTQRAK